MKIGPRSGTGTRASADPTRRKQAPRQTEDYRLETLDGELLLYHPAQTKTLYLNETASLVWNLCNGERTSDEICAILREAFPDASDVDADVESTLESLLHSRAITYGGKRSTRPGPVADAGPDAGPDAGETAVPHRDN